MAARHRHKFQRLSDVVLFCECGATKYVAEPVCTRSHTYYPTWIWPTSPTGDYPMWQPTITTGSITVSTLTNPPFPDGTTITYTADGPTS